MIIAVKAMLATCAISLVLPLVTASAMTGEGAWSTLEESLQGAGSSTQSVLQQTLMEMEARCLQYNDCLQQGDDSLETRSCVLDCMLAIFQADGGTLSLSFSSKQDVLFGAATATGTGDGESYYGKGDAAPENLSVSSSQGKGGASANSVKRKDSAQRSQHWHAGLNMAIWTLLVQNNGPEAELISQPQDITVLENEAATFTVQAEVHATPSHRLNLREKKIYYQWQVDGRDIAGATAASYTVTAAKLSDHGKKYRCAVKNSNGTVYSREATLQVEMVVPENTVMVSGIAVSWQDDTALVSWQAVQQDLRYQVVRAPKDGPSAVVGETAQSSYGDSTATYNLHWQYWVATIRDYIHPVSKKVYHAVGPLSGPVALTGQTMASVSFPEAELQADGVYRARFISGASYAGTYSNLSAPVSVSVGGMDGAVAASDGSFSLSFPSAGLWQVTATETEGNRSGMAMLQLTVDDDITPPQLSLHSAQEVTTAKTSTVIEGEAHDSESGVAAIQVTSDRFSTEFTTSCDADGIFSIEVPLKDGGNLLEVTALDRSGNRSSEQVTATTDAPALPQLTILSPSDGTSVSTANISISGTVRSSLAADQIRLLFGGQVYFPAGSDENYTFTIDDVVLEEGDNTLLVTAETVYGSVSDQVIVTYGDGEDSDDDDGEASAQPPSVQIYSPLPNAHLSADSFRLSGVASGDAEITSVLLNGQAATVNGSGTSVSFNADLAFAGAMQLSIDVVVTDAAGESTSLSYSVYHDDGGPQISLSAGIAEAPEVNVVLENPFVISGKVTDDNLGGLSINETTLGLLPLTQSSYTFSGEVNLESGQETLFTLKAWDAAGNTATRSVILRLDSSLAITVISPQKGAEYYTEDGSVSVDVALLIPGLAATDSVTVTIDDEAVSGLTRSDTALSGMVETTLADGEHSLGVVVESAAGVVLAKKYVSFSVIDIRLITLELLRQEPANNSSGARNNGFIGFYFNKTIDPSLLSVQVLETYHGMDYQLPVSGTDLTGLSDIDMVEVHRDREIVGGELAHFPAKTMSAFYPERNFAYGATVYVVLTYNGEELASTTFTVRSLPTFVQGFIADQFGDPLEGITVTLDELGRSSVTDAEGSYTFGFGDTEETCLAEGRYRATANPGLASGQFGSMEFFISIEEGRLNEMGVHNLPVLNTSEPFRQVQSGSDQVLLAGGELTLDLSDATLTFADGAHSGTLHAQFMPVNEQPYAYIPAGAPQWVFSLNPGEVTVDGHVGLTIKMPSMVGSYEYAGLIGERVVLVGLDTDSLYIVPVGVGLVDSDAHLVVSEGVTHFNRLDIIGYALVAEENQTLLQQYGAGTLSLSQLISALNQ